MYTINKSYQLDKINIARRNVEFDIDMTFDKITYDINRYYVYFLGLTESISELNDYTSVLINDGYSIDDNLRTWLNDFEWDSSCADSLDSILSGIETLVEAGRIDIDNITNQLDEGKGLDDIDIGCTYLSDSFDDNYGYTEEDENNEVLQAAMDSADETITEANVDEGWQSPEDQAEEAAYNAWLEADDAANKASERAEQAAADAKSAQDLVNAARAEQQAAQEAYNNTVNGIYIDTTNTTTGGVNTETSTIVGGIALGAGGAAISAAGLATGIVPAAVAIGLAALVGADDANQRAVAEQGLNNYAAAYAQAIAEGKSQEEAQAIATQAYNDTSYTITTTTGEVVDTGMTVGELITNDVSEAMNAIEDSINSQVAEAAEATQAAQEALDAANEALAAAEEAAEAASQAAEQAAAEAEAAAEAAQEAQDNYDDISNCDCTVDCESTDCTTDCDEPVDCNPDDCAVDCKSDYCIDYC